jgi:23S rRNA G2069 N7-methylase RlmK/C1962 C5-methylase RlmI
VKADAVEYMQQLAREGKSFDMVICDPPKLAPTRTSLPKAKNKYIRINTEAMRVLRPGGLLYTFSCSAAVTQTNALKEFVKEVRQQHAKQISPYD